jgi:glucan biosynthesis protein C
MAGESGMGTAPQRRGDLDRIRLVLAAATFLAACGLQAAGRDGMAAERWNAPCFFAVAGCAAVHAVRRTGTLEWVVAKVLRLFVPAVAGTLLLVVPLLFLRRPGEVDEWAGHLLFLPALFTCSLAMTPFLVRMRTPEGRTFADRCARPAAIALLLPAALPAALAAISRAGAWAGPASACVTSFALGAVITAGPALEAAVNRRRWASLVAAAMLLSGLAAVWTRDEPLALAARLPLGAAAAGSLVPVVLGFGLRKPAAGHPLPERINDWILPFFVLSRPAVLAVGRVMAGLPVGAMVRAAIAAVAAAAVALAACELVRRSGLLRFLFGLREQSDAS